MTADRARDSDNARDSDSASANAASGERLSADLEIVNEKGLHARASARFSATVEQFESAITVSRLDLTVNGESIMGLLMLAASKGSTIHVVAEGADAKEAIAALTSLVAGRFGETQ